MTEVVSEEIVFIAIVDIEGAPIDTGRISEIGFVVLHAAVPAPPLPNGVGRSNRLFFLHACEPGDVVLQYAVCDASKENSIAGDVVDC